MLIIHKLREDEELFPEELVGEVDRGIHDTGAVGADGVGDATDVDRVQMLVVAGALNENLMERRGVMSILKLSPLL